MREIGQGVYAFLFAHAVRVDPQDNIWVVDEMSGQIVKFDPDGRVLMILGRKPEAVAIRGAGPGGRGGGGGGGGRGGAGAPGAGAAGDQFNRPTDVAWDARRQHLRRRRPRRTRASRSSTATAASSCRGARRGPSRASSTRRIRSPPTRPGNVYVADHGNKRIQVFDGDGTFKSQIANIGVPTAICISGGSHQYLYSSHTGDPYGMDDAAIYKLELDGRVVGKFGTGRQADEGVRPRQRDRLPQRERAASSASSRTGGSRS